MRKKPQSSKKLGRDKVIEDIDLLKRYVALKQFLEWNWGRIGLKLQRIRKPSHVSAVFKLVPSIESLPAFRDHKASCFANVGLGPVRFPELRIAQRMHEEAIKVKDSQWLKFHGFGQRLNSGKTSLKLAVSEFGGLVSFFPIFYLLFAIGFRVQELGQEFATAQQALKQATQREGELGNTRAAKEAWFAQNEIVKFKVSRRYAIDPDNLAKAMAGMPEYGWLNSFRRCEKLNVQPLTYSPYTFRLFELVKQIVRRMKRLDLKKVEGRLLRELRSQPDPILRECVKPHWGDVKRAFADIRGKRFTRRELPFLVIGRFLDYMESSKSHLEVELAQNAQADFSIDRSRR